MARNLFNSVKLSRPPRSNFDLSHDVKLTTDMGRLTPVMCQEVVPGDKFNISAETLVRFAPMLAPVMHRMDVCIHYFFVPNRILWDAWGEWISGNIEVEAPYLKASEFTPAQLAPSSLANYLGIPQNINGDTKISALPFSAYQKIYDEYYRDENLQPPVWTQLGLNGQGDQTAIRTSLWQIRQRAWEHDYFTSALPFAQKGGAVDVPLGSIELEDTAVRMGISSGPGNFTVTGELDTNGVNVPVPRGDGDGNLYVEGQTVVTEPTTINDLRRAFKLQEWLERNARAGTRYVESILAHFGVKSSDARLQRPEYITGVKSPVIISEVLNNTGLLGSGPTEGGNVQGSMAGHGVGVVGGQKFGGYFCEEHGLIMGIMSVMPKPAYQQGLHKKFQKFDRFDYYWPTFANIGEQEVKQNEVYANSATPDKTFGYVPRYAEYKFEQNRVAGDFQTSLNFWHEGRIFENDPELNADFIACNPSKRIFAVTDADTDSLYVQVLNKVLASRPMSKFGSPGGI